MTKYIYQSSNVIKADMLYSLRATCFQIVSRVSFGQKRVSWQTCLQK